VASLLIGAVTFIFTKIEDFNTFLQQVTILCGGPDTKSATPSRSEKLSKPGPLDP
jgi:hypothetical protein